MNLFASFLSHKLLLLFVTATVALGIATIILGVDNTKLKNKIREMSSNTNSNDTNKYILPDSVKPILYDLYLYPDLTSGLYKGKIGISLKVLSTTNSISLNSHLLNIDKVEADSEDVNYSIEKQYQLLVIKKKDNSDFHKGKHTLEIEFNGSLLNRIVGFYSSSYRTSDGTSRKIATSKFEPTYARQAFPCFDEPNLKAKYKVHILKPKDASYIALSNFPVSNITKYDNDHELVSFEETVSMSTYLACFIVSDFTYSETSFDNMGKNIPLRVYASPGNLNKTQYAGEVGKKAIEFYIKYFQIPYPLPKLDMVAIPDFVSGAMEHWGLVTYRETALLYTDTTHSAANKQRVATVVAHELAHSWFGNLVTMNWWNDLWLNEGFASYIEYKGVLAAEPTWGMMDQFLVEDLHPVLILDSTLSSHAIVQTVVTPDQITEIFDLISYNKGASILRMLENTVGEANFQQGVKNYLNKYAYANAVTADFLKEIQNTVGDLLDVAEMMETFTVQMGYPVLNVTVSGNNYTFTQKRFLKDPSATYNENESEYKYKWSVPVTYVTDLGKSTNSTIFQFTDDSITISKPENAKWIKFNYDQVGYYRVNYPVSEWEKLISYYGDLSIADRSHLLEETFSLAEAGLLNYTLPLELSKKLTGEFDYLPLRVAYAKLSGVLTYLRGSNSTQEAAFKKYIAKIFIPAYNKFTWTEKATDSHLERIARVIALTAACSAEYKTCQDEAQIVFKKWLDTKEPLPPNLRALVYVHGIKKANKETWEKLLEIYKAENDAGEKLKLINGLANVENEELLKRLIELAKDESIVRRQDYIAVMGYIASNPYGTQCVWDWVRSNWEYLVDRFTLNDRTLGSLMPLIASQFATQEKFDEMKSFFTKYPEAGAGKANRAKALETVKNNIIWLSKYKTVVENWIVNNSES